MAHVHADESREAARIGAAHVAALRIASANLEDGAA